MRDYENTAKALRCCRLTSERGCAECPFGLNNNEKCANLLPDAADAIEELLAAVPHWISVEERLPEKDEMVIVYYSWIGQSGTEYKEVSLATLEEMRYCGNKLLGWMPLPEAPKEGTE